MKQGILCIMAMAIMGNAAVACDVCGCAASNQYMGLLPQYRWNFVGFQQSYSDFSSLHPSDFLGRPADRASDYYNTLQVWGRYNLGSKYQVYAFVPYHYNVHNEDDVRSVSSGVGDVSVLVNRVLLHDRGRKWKHTLLAGAGIKLPTGKYTGITILDKEGLPNTQPGTGSWDVITNANYTASHDKWGFNVDASYIFTTPNRDDYKYGNTLSVGGVAFRSITVKNFSLLPQAGLRYQYTLHDYDNYERKWLNDQSGGYICYATAGIQAYYKRMGARVTWQLPVSQYYGAGYVTARQKMETGIFLLF